mgnify:CR=1 FL=1
MLPHCDIILSICLSRAFSTSFEIVMLFAFEFILLDSKLAFDIALKRGYINQDYFKRNMRYLEATNMMHPKWPNCLFFKDYLTRETLRIKYNLSDIAEVVL